MTSSLEGGVGFAQSDPFGDVAAQATTEQLESVMRIILAKSRSKRRVMILTEPRPFASIS